MAALVRPKQLPTTRTRYSFISKVYSAVENNHRTQRNTHKAITLSYRYYSSRAAAAAADRQQEDISPFPLAVIFL